MPDKKLDEKMKDQKQRILALEEKKEKEEVKKQDSNYLKKIKAGLGLEKKENLDNIYLIPELELSKEIKIRAKQMALVAYKTGQYDLYKNDALIAKLDETGMIEFEEEYLKSLEEHLPMLKDMDLKEIDVEHLKEISKEEGKEDLKEVEEKEKEEKSKEEATEAIKEDTGLDIVSMVRIEDENFSKEIIGHETGYQDQFVALTRDGTYHLIGLNSSGKFEKNTDFLGASTAQAHEQPEYNQDGECCGKSDVDLVMRRSDGTRSNLGIDMSFGEITLVNRSTNEPIQTSNYTPTQSEIDQKKLDDAKGRYKNLEEEKAKEEQKKKEEEEKAKEEEESGWPEERKSLWE